MVTSETTSSSTQPLVPVHPEAVEHDPSSLRWVMAPDTLSFVGLRRT